MDIVQLGTDIGPGPDHWQSSRQAVSWKDSQADKQSIGKDSQADRQERQSHVDRQPAEQTGSGWGGLSSAEETASQVAWHASHIDMQPNTPLDRQAATTDRTATDLTTVVILKSRFHKTS